MNQTTTVTRKRRSVEMTQVALLSAIICLMAFVPFLGYIPLGFTRATILHIPVIIGALMLGPKKGAILGGVFGLTSLINNTFNPTITSFVFSPFYSMGEVQGGIRSLIICFVPRILIGIVAYYVYRGLKKTTGKQTLSLAAAGVVGSLVNTCLVMGMIALFFGEAYASAKGGVLGTIILSVIGVNGVPEAIVAGMLVTLIGKVLCNTKMMSQLGV